MMTGPLRYTQIVLSFLMVTSLLLTSIAQAQTRPSLLSESPRLVLTNDESNALSRLFEGTVQEQRGIGEHNFEKASVSKFVSILSNRLGQIPGNLRQSLAKLAVNSPYPIQGWLSDNGFHPFLIVAARTLLTQGLPPTDVDWVEGLKNEPYLANKPEAEVLAFVKAFQQVPFKVPAGYGNSSLQALGSDFGVEVFQYHQSRAQNLTENGRPVVFDPTLQAVLIHLDALKDFLNVSGKTLNPSFVGRVSEHFTQQARSFDSLTREIQAIETLTLDLQGLLDSIRFKMSHPQTDTQRELTALNQLLSEATRLKTDFALQVEKILRSVKPKSGAQEAYRNSSMPTIAQLARQMMPVLEGADAVFKRVRPTCTKMIREFDKIWGYGPQSDLSLKFDTPWELAFQQAREQAKSIGLAQQFDSIKDFEIITEERHYTAHWTTQKWVEEKNEKGEVTGGHYETEHHNTSSDEYSKQTINLPERDAQFEDRLSELATKILTSSKARHDGESAGLRDEVARLKSDLNAYLLDRATGQDEFEHKLSRIQNQLARLNSLEQSLKLQAQQSERNLATFNREATPLPEGMIKTRKALANLDAKRATRRNWVIGVTSSAAALGAACQYWMSAGGGL